MPLELAPWRDQSETWPREGRHVLAQHDDDTIVVYQAYRPEIGRWAAEHGRLGGPAFSLSRMSWIKPNFLWMMFRSGWGTKPDQEVTLAVRLPRAAFAEILAQAVPSSFDGIAARTWEDERAWKSAGNRSDVRLQWDPDHHPTGAPLERRALQLGLRGDTLRRFAQEWPLEIVDMSGFVAEQRAHVSARAWDRLMIPREDVLRVTDAAIAARVGVDDAPA